MTNKQQLAGYVEFFDDFIARFKPLANSEEKKEMIGRASEARILAYVGSYRNGITADGHKMSQDDYHDILKTFNEINEFLKTCK